MTGIFRQGGRLLVGVVLTIVFVSGAVAGAAAGVAVDRNAGPGRVIKTRVDGGLSQLYDRLDLTPEQRELADSVVARRAPQTEQLMREMADRLHAISDSVDAEFRVHLSPAQRATLDSLKQRQTLILKRKTPAGATIIDTVRQPRQ
ncbi:MAG TPA: hypothetical protein VFD64_17420 [Gemmatimonadaceae bacterium]|nr:hypothetical protein [Gemmatimonadaceae bacterium]